MDPDNQWNDGFGGQRKSYVTDYITARIRLTIDGQLCFFLDNLTISAKSTPRAVLHNAVSPSPSLREIRIFRGVFAVHRCLSTRQFNQAWAVLSPASLQIW